MSLRVIGIDPGVASTGYGIIDINGESNIDVVSAGVIKTTPRESHGYRLKKIFDKVAEIIELYRPDVVALENIYYSRNLKSLVEVSEAIGVVTLAAYNMGVEVVKFTPLEVKAAVTGFGKATKYQVQLMVKNLLNLEEVPDSNHVSDALAVALCYKNMHI